MLDVVARRQQPRRWSKGTAVADADARDCARPRQITTSRPPDLPLLRYSIADSLAAHKPFVVTFATPKFCTSRTCGPVVDVVQAVRRRFERRGVRFIHVEVYTDNDPRTRLQPLDAPVGPAARSPGSSSSAPTVA